MPAKLTSIERRHGAFSLVKELTFLSTRLRERLRNAFLRKRGRNGVLKIQLSITLTSISNIKLASILIFGVFCQELLHFHVNRASYFSAHTIYPTAEPKHAADILLHLPLVSTSQPDCQYLR